MSLDEIINEIKNDPRNEEYTKRGIPPIFQINPNARILIIGQAPGRKVEESCIPFNDKSGEKLINWLGIDKETFHLEKNVLYPKLNGKCSNVQMKIFVVVV